MKRKLLALVTLLLIAGAAGAWTLRPSSSSTSPTALVERLGSPDTAIDAFQRLDRNPDPAVRAAIVQGLRAQSPEVRGLSARLLSRQEEVDALPELKHMLVDPSFKVRIQAAHALLVLAPWDSVVRIADDPAGPLRAREALLRAFVDDTIDAAPAQLRAVLDDPRQPARLRVAAAGLLRHHYRNADNARRFARIAADPQESLEMRVIATGGIGSCTQPPPVELLRAQVYDSTRPWRLREAGVSGLGLTNSAAAIPVLAAIVDDPTLPTGLRDFAITNIGRIEGRTATDQLLTLLESDQTWVRRGAANALHCRCEPSAVTRLEAALAKETDPDVEHSIEDALSVQHQGECPPSH